MACLRSNETQSYIVLFMSCAGDSRQYTAPHISCYHVTFHTPYFLRLKKHKFKRAIGPNAVPLRNMHSVIVQIPLPSTAGGRFSETSYQSSASVYNVGHLA